MPAKLLTGKEVAQKMELDIQKDVQAFKARGINPMLKIMIVGDASDSLAYANNAKKWRRKMDLSVISNSFPAQSANRILFRP